MTADVSPAPPAPVRWGLGDAVLATTIAIVAGVILGAAVVTISGYRDFDDAPLSVLALAQIPLWAGLLGVPWWAARRKGRGSLRDDFGLRMEWRDIPLGLVVGIACQIMLAVLAPIYRLFGVDPDRVGESAEQLADKADDPTGVLLLFLVTVVGASIIEEICYRGLWLRSLQHRFSTPIAIVLSGVVFGAIHFQLLELVPLALVGMVFAALAVRHDRLGPAIWAHAAFNATAVVALLATSS